MNTRLQGSTCLKGGLAMGYQPEMDETRRAERVEPENRREELQEERGERREERQEEQREGYRESDRGDYRGYSGGGRRAYAGDGRREDSNDGYRTERGYGSAAYRGRRNRGDRYEYDDDYYEAMAGRRGSMMYGVREFLQRPHVRQFLFGAGAAYATAMLWPVVRPTLRPLAVRAAAGVIQLADQTLSAVARAREDVEDIFAEARETVHEERHNIMGGADDDLRAAVSTMQSEFRELRDLLQKVVSEREVG